MLTAAEHTPTAAPRAQYAAELATRLAIPALFLALPLEFTGALLPAKLDLSRLIDFAAAAALVYLVWRGLRTVVLPRQLSAAAIAIFALYAVVSWLATRAPGSTTSLIGIVIYPALAVLVMNLAATEGDHGRYWAAFLIAGAAVSAIGIFLYFTHLSIWRLDPSGHFRVNSTFGDPDIMARFTSMVVCAAVLLRGSTRVNRNLAYGAAIAAGVVTPLTLSRIGIVVFAGSLVLGTVLAADRKRALVLAAVALIAFTAVTTVNTDSRDRAVNAFHAVVATADAALHPHAQQPANPGSGAPPPSPIPETKKLANLLPLDEERRYLIAAGLQMFLDHPVLGVGFGGFQHSLLTHYRQYMNPAVYKDTLSHTSVVTVLGEQGLVGMAVLLAIIALFLQELVRATRHRRREGVWMLLPAALMTIIFVDSQFEARLFTEPYLWVCLGLAYAVLRRRPSAGGLGVDA